MMVNNAVAPVPNKRLRCARYWASGSLLALIALSLAWELWLAPLRDGGSWLALKALPLCLPLAGILRGRRYTYQYLSLLILFYLAEAVVRLFDAVWLSRVCAGLSLLLCLILFVACLVYAKQAATSSD